VSRRAENRDVAYGRLTTTRPKISDRKKSAFVASDVGTSPDQPAFFGILTGKVALPATVIFNLAIAELAIDFPRRLEFDYADYFARMSGLWRCFGCASCKQDDRTQKTDFVEHG
jgi:hypothetical protein